MSNCPRCGERGAYVGMSRVECLSKECEAYSEEWALENLPPEPPPPEPPEWDLDYDSLPETPVMPIGIGRSIPDNGCLQGWWWSDPDAQAKTGRFIEVWQRGTGAKYDLYAVPGEYGRHVVKRWLDEDYQLPAPVSCPDPGVSYSIKTDPVSGRSGAPLDGAFKAAYPSKLTGGLYPSALDDKPKRAINDVLMKLCAEIERDLLVMSGVASVQSYDGIWREPCSTPQTSPDASPASQSARPEQGPCAIVSGAALSAYWSMNGAADPRFWRTPAEERGALAPESPPTGTPDDAQ